MQMLSLKRCCNIIVDFAATASQNVFKTFMVSPHEKTNIINKITKKIKLLLYIIIGKSWSKRSLYDTFVELFKHRFVIQQ